MKTFTGRDIELAIDFLRKDEIVAIPTETVYGLACNAFSETAVRKIYKLKGRIFNNPLTIHVSDFNKVYPYILEVPEVYLKIAARYCPGPVTFVFNKSAIVPDFLTSGLPTIGIRIPDNHLALELLRITDFPVAVTSANPSDKKDSLTVEEVLYYFNDKIPYIINGCKSRLEAPSTVIEFRKGELKGLRKGKISLSDMLSL
jgi:L-threonylcarbamoyladenylate synthase